MILIGKRSIWHNNNNLQQHSTSYDKDPAMKFTHVLRVKNPPMPVLTIVLPSLPIIMLPMPPIMTVRVPVKPPSPPLPTLSPAPIRTSIVPVKSADGDRRPWNKPWNNSCDARKRR